MGLFGSLLIGASKNEGHLPYLELVLAFNAAVYALHTYLDFRQLRVCGAWLRISQMLERPVPLVPLVCSWQASGRSESVNVAQLALSC